MHLTLEIATDYIKLDSVLKWGNVVDSGGQAKHVIVTGQVRVNDQVELRRGRKLFPGDRVTLTGYEIMVQRAA